MGKDFKTFKKKKYKTKTLKEKADLAFSNFIRDRDGWKCITCGSECEDPSDPYQRKFFHAGHYIPRNCLPLRYAENNVHCQCFRCNVWMKGNYTVYALKMIEKYGPDILFKLDEIKKDSIANPKKYGHDFYKKIIKQYSQENTAENH